MSKSSPEEKSAEIVRVDPSSMENAEDLLREAAPDVLNSVPPKQRERLRLVKLTTTTTIENSMSYSGPLPPPEQLAKFDEIIPHGAERIMTMAENQSAHRIGIEDHVVRSQ